MLTGISGMITQAIAMAAYILYPSQQDLRPTEFARDNLLTHIAALLYAFDTNTGVCLSLHVAYSLGIGSTWLKEKQAFLWWKAFVVAAVIVISFSTTFVKQHSGGCSDGAAGGADCGSNCFPGILEREMEKEISLPPGFRRLFHFISREISREKRKISDVYG